MPEGPLGFPRLTSIGPFVDDTDTIYHVTTRDVAQFAKSEGLKTDVTPKEYTNIADSRDKAVVERKFEKTIKLDTLMDEYRPTSVPPRIPDRRGSLFFWTSKEAAEEFVVEGERDHIIEVDPDRIPCEGGVGIAQRITPLERYIIGGLFSVAPYEDVVSVEDGDVIIDKPIPDELEDFIYAVWMEYSVYTGQTAPGVEVWYDCNVPPEAIVSVEKSSGNGKVLVEGNTGAQDFDSGIIESQTRQVLEECSEQNDVDMDIGDIYCTGYYAEGNATPGLTPMAIYAETNGFVDGVSDVVSCAMFNSQRIIQGVENYVRRVDISTSSRGYILANAVEKRIRGDDPPNTVFNMTTGELITAQEAAEELVRGGMTEAYQSAIHDALVDSGVDIPDGPEDDHEELMDYIDRVSKREFGLSLY